MYLSSGIFQNITQEQFDKMLECFQSHKKKYSANEVITTYDKGSSKIGIILQGEVLIVRTHYDGHQTILERLESGDIFGEMLAIVPSSVSFIQVISAKPCSVQYIDYQCLIKRCSKACPWHSLLVNNVLLLITQKAVHLTERLEVLSQRTTREKLLCYFSLTASHCGSNSFQLPFSLSTLADYLSVDRSAMMREIKKLKDEHLITLDRRCVTLFPNQFTPSFLQEKRC